MKKIDFSNLLPEKIGINPFNWMYNISLDRPENLLLCGIFYVNKTVKVI